MPASVINVRYTKENFGIVPLHLLDTLISNHKIIQFYRESEKKWVTVGTDAVRHADSPYEGPEKRSEY